MKKVELIGLDCIPEIEKDDDIGQIIIDNFPDLKDHDIIVIAQKIISKSENRIIDLRYITPSKNALEIASKTGRDPRFCEVIIKESKEILGLKGAIIVTKLNNGMIVTSAGIDKSNIDTDNGNKVILLPLDSDESARRIRKTIKSQTQKTVAVIINDSLGEPSREGSIGKAIGFNGIIGLERPKEKDRFENSSTPIINLVDELSAAASILMGQSSQGIPIVIIRGAQYTEDETTSIESIIINV